jgi:hypothetical protein
MIVSVRTPKITNGNHEEDCDDDDDPDEYRLPEADEDHNRWKDAMWLHNDHSRVLLVREGKKSIVLYSADADPKGSQALLEVIETDVLDLLEEYRGIQRHVFVACPVSTCSAWHDVRNIAAGEGASAEMTCPGCKNTYPMDNVVASGVGVFGPKHFDAGLVRQTQSLLQWALDPRVCQAECNFLGIDPPATEETTPGDCPSPVDLTHYDFLAALDKVIRALLLRGVLQRPAPVINSQDI